MLRRVFLKIPFLSVWLKGNAEYFELQKISSEFDLHWDIFVRDLFGCKHDAEINQENCNATQAKINYSEFKNCRDIAKKLFSLHE